MSFCVFTVVQFRIPFFWDVMLSNSRVSERQWGIESSKMKATSSYEMSATTYRATQHHILKDRNPCNFTLHLQITKQWMLFLWAQWYLGYFLWSIALCPLSLSINKLYILANMWQIIVGNPNKYRETKHIRCLGVLQLTAYSSLCSLWQRLSGRWMTLVYNRVRYAHSIQLTVQSIVHACSSLIAEDVYPSAICEYMHLTCCSVHINNCHLWAISLSS
jgi:hypothetical protein